MADRNSRRNRLAPVVMTLCAACLEGKGGECHTPGCALWMNRAPDVPIQNYEDVGGIARELYYIARDVFPEEADRLLAVCKKLRAGAG